MEYDVKINSILKLADKYYLLTNTLNQNNYLNKKFSTGIPLKAPIPTPNNPKGSSLKEMAALLIIPIVFSFLNKIFESKNIKEDVESIVSHLDDYKKSYSEDYNKYKTQFDQFLDACKNLESSLEKLSSTTPNKDNVLIIRQEIKNFQKQIDLVQDLGPPVQQYLTQLESVPGKILNTIMDFSFVPQAAGTDTIKIRNSINSLLQHIAMEKPVIMDKFKEMESKYNEVMQAYNKPESSAPIINATPSAVSILDTKSPLSDHSSIVNIMEQYSGITIT